MAVTVKVDEQSQLGAGLKIITGSIAMDSVYNTGAEVMDISAHFKSATHPLVIISPASGYLLEHNKGTAAAGLVVARYSAINHYNGANEVLALVEVAQSTDLSAVNAAFTAIGQPY